GAPAGGGAGAGSVGAAWSAEPGAWPRGRSTRARGVRGRCQRGGVGRRGAGRPLHPRRHRPRPHGPGLEGALRRHARRGAQGPGRARSAVVPSLRRSIALRDALAALGATTPFVWTGGPITPPEARPDAVLCTALPSRDELAALARLGGGEPVVFIAAIQLPFLRS